MVAVHDLWYFPKVQVVRKREGKTNKGKKV